MDSHPVKGWYRDPAGPDEFRYWDGNDWTAHATVSEEGKGRSIAVSGRPGEWDDRWYRRILSTPVVSRLLAWIDDSVPVARSRIRRLMQPQWQGSVDQAGSS